MAGPADVGEARLLLLAALQHAALVDPSLPHAQWYAQAVGRARARPPTEGAPAALALAYLIEHEDQVADFLRHHRVQTNEIARSTALLPGFLVAGGFGLPLRLRELGASAGLNLRFDRYRYHYLGGPKWGPSAGPLLEARAEGAIPSGLSPPTVEVDERCGVDLQPIDPTTPGGAALLHAFVWADEHDRHERLDEAITVSRATPVRMDQGDLIAWAEQHAAPAPGTTTVLYHSQVAYQLDDAEVTRLGNVVERCLRAATDDAPFVALSFEAPRGEPLASPEVYVQVGDGSGPPRRWTLATSDFHGRWVRWW